MTGKVYTCACCGGTYESDRSDDEAAAEFDQMFPGHPKDDAEVVCDDCFKQMFDPQGAA